VCKAIDNLRLQEQLRTIHYCLEALLHFGDGVFLLHVETHGLFLVKIRKFKKQSTRNYVGIGLDDKLHF
jgi:hypothetical protein